jgi:diguanylate cyclase
MQRDTAELNANLENSRSQIEKLRWNLAEAQELGMRDPLTALNNRRCFDINLAKEIAEARANGTEMCLVMGDIDRFKAVNDTFGHLIGDEILKMFARLLSSNVKGRDTVARFGGEEFAIILPETGLEDAQTLTEDIRRQLEAKQLALNNSGVPIGKITASFGVAQLAERDDAATLVQRADAKLYEAKSAGRNRVVIDRPAAA